ncbi:hypothetical protein ACNSOL_00285 [Aliarcobacter lanthieri]|uniref:hypothetical protein n=1 Tax=Aliarcobacter lanthieri TaxID=1355374 RepID=UPI003AB0FA4D
MILNKIIIAIISLSTMLLSTTYEIKEQDLILEIENKAPELEKKIEEQKKVIIEKIDNLTGEVLLKAQENRIKYIDPTYILDKDIPKYDKFGRKIGVLYAKGYTFNPIEFMSVVPPDFIIFNACDPSETKYVNNLIKDYEEKLKDYMLVNSGCKNKDLRKTEFNSKVYFLTKEMRDKFEVEHTVSIIYIDKEKKRIAVKEVSADEKDNN